MREAGAAYTVLLLVVPIVFAVAWGSAVRGLVRLTRSRMSGGEPTDELLDTPPAVVDLLVHELLDAPHAVQATLLDLADRGLLELRPRGTDPGELLVVVRHRGPGECTDFERRLLDLVSEAGDEPTLARLAANAGAGLHRGLVDEVREHAMDLGYVRRADHWAGTAMALGAIIAMFLGDAFGGTLFALLVPEELRNSTWPGVLVVPAALVGAMLVMMLLFVTGGEYPDMVFTARGRQVLAHWVRVRRSLEADSVDQSLTAYREWDRRLVYAVALGVAPVAAASADLGVGRVEVVGIRRNGGWRPVPVRYPRHRPRMIDAPAGGRLVFAALLLGLVPLLYRLLVDVAELAPSGRAVCLAAGAIVMLWATYRAVRALADLAFPARITGEVLRIVPLEVAGGWSPVGFQVVIDDGADRMRAVGGADGPARPRQQARCTGDPVSIRGQRWTGHAVRIRSLDGVALSPGTAGATTSRITTAATGATDDQGQVRPDLRRLIALGECPECLGIAARVLVLIRHGRYPSRLDRPR